ncbi:DUF937 domain-containing protein [Acinetobacter qingfengensis]|uniref:Uncharacterized protein n=1 Tax=Acinetobacter qingfengensis TaxID=1262585 RepID=A0A1E7RE12_9GAMM|nr:YidB family protein [Acinetobacter qingfengensis]KAA8734741.1 DUF937 domain-containing protein [Acinetobacter qingfengensis]OEY97659.1 hypothetical protein BJI46_08575 [Acinetobacter qingfengensis]
MTNLSDLVESLAKQALGGQNNQQGNQSQSGLGGILGSVLGQLGNQGGQNQNAQSGLGGILGSVLGSLGQGNTKQTNTGSGSSALLIAVLPLILGWIQQQGGLQGALDKLKQAGLADQVQSWVNPDHANNANVAEQQLQSLFDDAQVEQVADQANTTKESIYSAIASALPQIIDSLTPKGEQTNTQEANNDIQNLLANFLKR